MVKLYWVEDKWGITGHPSMRANATRFTPESITAKLNFTCNWLIIGDMSRKSKSTTIVIYTYSLSPVAFTLHIRALLGDDCKQPHHNHYRFQQSMFQGTTTARQQPHAGWNVERLTISIYMQILDCKIIIIFILWVIIITPIWLAASFATIIALSALASPRSIARWRRKTDVF